MWAIQNLQEKEKIHQTNQRTSCKWQNKLTSFLLGLGKKLESKEPTKPDPKK